MGNVYKPVEPRSRLAAEYAEAKILFEKRQRAMGRIAEIDRELRNLSKEDPEAVQAAQSDIPFRKLPGRPKPGEKTVPASAS
jgi:hypothetical protein